MPPIFYPEFVKWQAHALADACASETGACHSAVRSIVCQELVPRYEAQQHNWRLLCKAIEMVMAEIHGHDFDKHDTMDDPIRRFLGVIGLPGYEFQHQVRHPAPAAAVPEDYDLRVALFGMVSLARVGGPIATFLKANYRTLSPNDVFGIEGINMPHEEDQLIVSEKQGLLARCREQLELVCRTDVADYLLRSHLFGKTAKKIADEDLGNYLSLSPHQQEEHRKLRDNINHHRAYWRPADKRPLTEEALQAILPNLKI